MARFESFKNLTAGVQSVVLSLAVVASGLWALCRFVLLEDVVAADISIEVQQMSSPERGSTGARLNVKLVNQGSRYLEFDLLSGALMVQKLGLGADGSAVAEREWRLYHVYALPFEDGKVSITGRQTLQPGASRNLVYYSTLDGPGIYLATFRVPVAERDLAKMGNEEDRSHPDASKPATERDEPGWSVTEFFEITGSPAE